jgi:hypothetical protein
MYARHHPSIILPHLFLLIAGLTVLYHGHLKAQDYYEAEHHFQFQFYSGYESFAMNDAFFSTLTGGDIDYSPIGTRVVIDQKARDFSNTIGLRLGIQQINERSNYRHNFAIDFMTNSFVGPVYLAKVGLVYEPEFHRPESPLSAFLGLGIGVSHIWGDIGEVGDGNDADIYFDAPDGTLFPSGSTISMRSDGLPFFSVHFGVRYYFGKYHNVFVMGGYQFSQTADTWHYRIISDDDSEIIYELPLTPFPESPSNIEQDGSFFRIGFSVVAAPN